ncbi:hypothetical protein IG195_18815 [Arthrobacter sp. TES]|nr:hypothetical protein [Paenarthrobacter ureafaciens]NKR14052.1 hypothetical protein [Arthrobacter sp. M5]NKR18340.1 hypothetical protein [Arthrobacter sp. M6]QOI63483.1 hypothetical protein IG195_18815 [Arthrobacter sp. TES]NWL29324.1 hypothetical protein [Paenarthrobacter ureafaciens]QMU82317.1 hypothetical protein FV140_09435 [Paenarthrobacter ureafaciens]
MAANDSRSFYTRGDSLSVGTSRQHIESALAESGATDVLFSQRGHLHALAFRSQGRQFRIILSAPRPPGNPALPGEAAIWSRHESTSKTLELDARRLWHAFALSIDAKLAAAAAGVATLESEFLAHVVLPGNHTVIDELEPVIASSYQSGQPPLIRTATPPLDG